MMLHKVHDEPALQEILFCTDFSKNADLAFEFAVGAATRHAGSTLHLLHVIPEPEAQFWKTYVYEIENVDQKAMHDIDAKIREDYLSRIPDSITLEIHVRIGRDAAEIINFAEEHEIDLIIMGRQGNSQLGKFLFGNVTEKVTRKANCPILVVPDSSRKRPTMDKD